MPDRLSATGAPRNHSSDSLSLLARQPITGLPLPSIAILRSAILIEQIIETYTYKPKSASILYPRALRSHSDHPDGAIAAGRLPALRGMAQELAQLKPHFPEITAGSVEIAVSGQVTDAQSKEPMPGVNVLVKGTTVGAVTNTEGRYAITAPDPNGTLVFSNVGFTSQEVPINNRSVINVAMAADVKALSEVVVTALGIKREAKNWGMPLLQSMRNKSM